MGYPSNQLKDAGILAFFDAFFKGMNKCDR